MLSKFKFNCDEIDKSIPDPLPQNLNHFMLIVGKPGSSKTTLLLNLICKRGKMYNKNVFDRMALHALESPTLPPCAQSTPEALLLAVTQPLRWGRSCPARQGNMSGG